MDGRVAGAAAGYGHACSNCARAKCKCIVRIGGSCERCHRTGKECIPAATVRKRVPRKAPATARRAQLEDKLDDLVTLLQAQHATKATEATADAPRAVHVVPQIRPAAGGPTLTPPSSTPSEATHGEQVTPAEADQLLTNFRNHHMACFPFVHIPDAMTATELQHERPLLWSLIHGIQYKSPDEQVRVANSIPEILARQLVVDGERNIDLLLGALCSLAWPVYFARGKPYFCLVSNLALTLLFDLGIDRPSADGAVALVGVGCVHKGLLPISGYRNRVRTNEDRRALLASYVLVAIIYAMAHRHDSMAWSAQIEEAVQVLSHDREWPRDELLVAIARIWRIADEAVRLNRQGGCVPAVVHIKSLLASLEQTRSTFSADLLQNKSLNYQMHGVKVRILELALPQLPPTPLPQLGLERQRIEYMHACLQACQHLLNGYLTFETAEYIGFSLPLHLHFINTLTVLYRLSLLDDPAWDRSVVRTTADVISYLEQGISKLEQIHQLVTAGAPQSELTVHTKAAGMLRMTVPVWAAALEKAGSMPTVPPVEQQESSGLAGDAILDGDPTAMDFEETWFTDMLTSWDGP